MNKTALWTMGGVALACALVACGGGGDDAADNTPRNIDIQFAAVAGAQAVDCSTNLTNLGTGSASGGLKDMRFYISDVKLVRADGVDVPLTLGANSNWNVTQGDSAVTLIDLENNTGSCVGTAATNTGIQGTVPAGNYVGVKMTLGVPFALNHTDQGADVGVTPAVVNNAVHPGMAWSWAGGRKFAKIEVTNAAWTAAPTFNVHLGSTGCTGTNPSAGQVDSCSAPNRLNFELATFNPSTQKIALDVQALLAANDVTVNGGGPTGCMSGKTDPECAGVFGKLGVDLDTGLTKADNSQALFRVVAR